MSDEPKDVTTESDRPAAFTGTGEGSKAPLVPKNVQKLAARTVVLLLAVAAILGGLQWWKNRDGDLDLGGAETKGNILALKLLDDGSRVVVIRPDGTVEESSDYRPGASDRDAVWYPSGNRVLFVSDRKEGATHIYRWNPGKNDDPQQKTVDESSRGEIAFAREPGEKTDDSALVATRGNIEEFFPSQSKSVKILPPSLREIAQGTGDEAGSQGTFQALYQELGTSFRAARWCRDKTRVAAIMRRGDEGGEVLVIQSLVPDEKGVLPPPAPVIAGERIDMDVNPATGDLAFSCTFFDFPTARLRREATVNGKVQRPFRHVLGLVDLSDNLRPQLVIVAAATNDQNVFGPPSVAPDGSRLLVPVGTWKDAAFAPQGLVVFPARQAGGSSATPVKQGEIYEPSWSPDGDRIVYIRRDGEQRTIFVAGADGSGETAVARGKGDFAHPLFSPQK